jgi:hypothetical protein
MIQDLKTLDGRTLQENGISRSRAEYRTNRRNHAE